MRLNTSFIRTFNHSRFGKDVIITFFIQIIIMLCAFIVNKIVSNRLDVNDFGLFNIIKRSSSVLSFVMLAGTGIALPRYLSIYREKKQYFKSRNFTVATLLLILAISLILSIVLIIFRNQTQSLVIGQDNINLMITFILYSFCIAISSSLFAYYRGINDFLKFNYSQLIIQITLLTPLIFYKKLEVCSIYLSWSVIIILISFVIIFNELKSNHFIFFRNLKIHNIFCELGILLKYTSTRLLGDFFLFSISAFPVLYLNQFLDMKSVAYYSVGITFVSLASPLFSFLGMILLPYVSSCLASNNFAKANILIRKLLIIYLVVSFFIALFFIAFMPFLISLFFSNEYLPAINISRIISISIIPQALYLLMRNPIDAISILPFNTINLFITFVVLIILFFASDSLEYYAFAYSISFFILGVLSISSWTILKRKNNGL